MENPYITAIHTWPRMDANAMPGLSTSNQRSAYMMVEYGPKPANLQTVAGAATVATS